MKKIAIFILAISSLICLSSCSKNDSSESKSLSISPSSLTLSVGEKGTATIIAKGVNDYKIDFSDVEEITSHRIQINEQITVIGDTPGSGVIYVYSASDSSIKGSLKLTIK